MLGLVPSGVWVLNPTDTNQDYSVLWLNVFVRAREAKKKTHYSCSQHGVG